MSDNENEQKKDEKVTLDTRYVRKSVYSRRHKKHLTKNVSRERHTEEEANEILKEFIKKVKEDNELYSSEKKDILERKSIHEIDNKQKESELERIEMNKILDRLTPDTGNSIMFFGRSKSGKTHCLFKLLDEWLIKDPSLIPIFFVGNTSNPMYEQYKKKFPFFDSLKPSIILTLKEINSFVKKKYNFLIILDDVISLRHCNVVSNLTISFRNSNLSSLILLQNATLVMKNARANSSIYLMFNNLYEETKALQERFLKSMPFFQDVKNMDGKIKLYRQVTEDHNFLVYFAHDDPEKLYISKCK